MLSLRSWHPKSIGKHILCSILERQVLQLRSRHNFKIVAIVGSVGKTSTKMAVAVTLNTSGRVIWEQGNYNDRLTVPLVLFGQTLPGLLNAPAWFKIWLKNRQVIRGPFPYDVAVLELGTDTPGDIAEFAYLKPDILLVTALTPEHMEYFHTMDGVAAEELSAVAYSKDILVNIDDTPIKYLKDFEFASYGLQPKATYYASDRRERGFAGQSMRLHLGESAAFDASVSILGEQGAKITVAAAATARMLGISNRDIEHGLKAVEAFAGRMRVLPGIMNSTLIDDSYNATPIAVKAALDVLYAATAPQRIAILGSMNELGDFSAEAHREVGAYCDPKKLDVVVVIGDAAIEYLAPVAKERGCHVECFKSPYAAGEYIKKHLKKGALVLAKGSQNGVFAEEALKILLANPSDADKMVRQSPYWLDVKASQFNDVPV